MSSRQAYWPAPPHDASWPPTVMRLRPYVVSDGDVEMDELRLPRIVDDDPLSYFLSPASADPDAEGMMEFDAGIEGASKRPPDIVRSVSPSSLSSGLRLPPVRASAVDPAAAPRPPTPPSPDQEFDMPATPDDEDYGYFARAQSLLPVALRDVVWKPRASKHAYREFMAADAFLSPVPPSLSPPLPCLTRSPGRGRGAAPCRSKPGRLSGRSWREPSPDVWAIEEETEQQVESEKNEQLEVVGGHGAGADPVSNPDAKPKKRVRFVLPGEELGTQVL